MPCWIRATKVCTISVRSARGKVTRSDSGIAVGIKCGGRKAWAAPGR